MNENKSKSWGQKGIMCFTKTFWKICQMPECSYHREPDHGASGLLLAQMTHTTTGATKEGTRSQCDENVSVPAKLG